MFGGERGCLEEDFHGVMVLSSSLEQPLIYPDWPLPKGVHAAVSTRHGGFSQPPYASLNLGAHVGDDPQVVAKNRHLLNQYLPSEPIWLNQVHGTDIWFGQNHLGNIPTADGAVSVESNQVLAIMTADCLPVLLSDEGGRVIGAAHAGWRGLCQGVIDQALEKMFQFIGADERRKFNSSITAWLGPAIGQAHFEVGSEVRDAFMKAFHSKDQTSACFIPSDKEKKYLADLHGLARLRLQELGVVQIYGKPHCCFEDELHFFSYRRENPTGRFASFIWKD